MSYVIVHAPKSGGLVQWTIPDNMTLADGLTKLINEAQGTTVIQVKQVTIKGNRTKEVYL